MVELRVSDRKKRTVYKSDVFVGSCIEVRTFFIIFTWDNVEITALFIHVLKKGAIFAQWATIFVGEYILIHLLNCDAFYCGLYVFCVFFQVWFDLIDFGSPFLNDIKLLVRYDNSRFSWQERAITSIALLWEKVLIYSFLDFQNVFEVRELQLGSSMHFDDKILLFRLHVFDIFEGQYKVGSALLFANHLDFLRENV